MKRLHVNDQGVKTSLGCACLRRTASSSPLAGKGVEPPAPRAGNKYEPGGGPGFIVLNVCWTVKVLTEQAGALMDQCPSLTEQAVYPSHCIYFLYSVLLLLFNKIRQWIHLAPW